MDFENIQLILDFTNTNSQLKCASYLTVCFEKLLFTVTSLEPFSFFFALSFQSEEAKTGATSGEGAKSIATEVEDETGGGEIQNGFTLRSSCQAILLVFI